MYKCSLSACQARRKFQLCLITNNNNLTIWLSKPYLTVCVFVCVCLCGVCPLASRLNQCSPQKVCWGPSPMPTRQPIKSHSRPTPPSRHPSSWSLGQSQGAAHRKDLSPGLYGGLLGNRHHRSKDEAGGETDFFFNTKIEFLCAVQPDLKVPYHINY